MRHWGSCITTWESLSPLVEAYTYNLAVFSKGPKLSRLRAGFYNMLLFHAKKGRVEIVKKTVSIVRQKQNAAGKVFFKDFSAFWKLGEIAQENNKRSYRD